MTVCQTDGFLFRDMAVVTLIAETIEEIVPVAYLETFFAFGVLQRLAPQVLRRRLNDWKVYRGAADFSGTERGSCHGGRGRAIYETGASRAAA